MAKIKSEIKRGFLRQLYQSSVATQGGSTFLDILNGFQSTKYDTIKSGRLIASSGGNSYSVAFQIPGIGGHFKEEEIFALSEEFISLYEFVTGQQTLTTDAAIFSAMMASDQLYGVNQTQNDYTLTRTWVSGP